MAENFEIKDINSLTYDQHAELFKALQKEAEKSPEKAVSLLPKFYSLLAGKGTSLDMLPTAAEVFATISQNLTQSQISDAVKLLHIQNKNILFERGTAIICQKNPVCAKPIFDHIAFLAETEPYSDDKKNFFVPAVRNMTTTLLCASDAELPQMLQKTFRFEPKVQELFASSYGKLYAQRSQFKEILWNKILQDASVTHDFSRLYQNIEDVIQADNEKIPDCLHIIRSKITDTKQTSSDLKKAYEVLGKIRNSYAHTKKVDEILMLGLQNSQNSTTSRRTAYRLLEKFDELTSRSSIGQRVKKTSDNPHGFKNVDAITTDETAILFLGGNGTTSAKGANGYLSSLEELLQTNNIKENVSLYATVYDFGEIADRTVAFNDHLARKKLLQDHHRNVKLSVQLNEDTRHPRYVEDLFNKAFLRRICDKNGKRLSAEEACAKMRQLTVVSHCHGAYTFLKLEEKMQQKMQELGYTAQEQAKIQHELLCVAHAPYAPLGVSKSTMISFVSATDFDITHYNNFETEIRTMAKNHEVMLSYFPGKQGEMFLTPSMGEDAEQHNFLGYDIRQKDLSKEGKAILVLAGNTIVNGVRNSLSGNPLPPVKEIVCGQDEKIQKFFTKLQENGVKMWQKVSENTALRLKAKGEREV